MSRNLLFLLFAFVIALSSGGCSDPWDPFSFAYGPIEDEDQYVSPFANKVEVDTHKFEVTSVSPKESSGGGWVKIAGHQFGKEQGRSTVSIGGLAAEIVRWSDTTITAIVPVEIAGGKQTLEVAVGANKGTTTLTVLPKATVLTTRLGPAGTPFTLKGVNFGSKQSKNKLMIGDTAATITSWTSTAINAVVPAAAPGGTHKVIAIVGGIKTKGLDFEVIPSLLGVTPIVGSGGTVVSITGISFGASQAAGFVQIGDTEIPTSSWSNTSIVLSLPDTLPGGIYRLLVSIGGQTSGSIVFSVLPKLTAVEPSIGVNGVEFVVTGGNFGPGQKDSTVTVGGEAATVLSWIDTQIRLVVSPALPAGISDLVVTVGGQESTGIPVTIRPTISALSPPAGEVDTFLTVSGGNFGNTLADTTIRVGGLDAPVISWSNQLIIIGVPSLLAPGVHNVLLSVAGQFSNALPYTVTEPGAPVLQSLSPVSGPVGASVTLAGLHFGATQSTSTVTVGGLSAIVVSWADTAVEIYVPALPTGSHDVVVSVNGEPSNALPFAVTTLTSPYITSVLPVAGSAGAVVTLTGARFGESTTGSTLALGGFSLTPTTWTTGRLVVTIPSTMAAGIHSFVVTVNGENSNSVAFTIVPTVNSITPVEGPQGSAVTLSGVHFGGTQGASRVTIGGITAVPFSWSNTSVTFNAPPGLTATQHAVVVTVAQQASNTVYFSVTNTSGFSITGVSPASGFAGTLVTITGTGFGPVQGVSSLSLGGVIVAPSSWASGRIEFSVPATIAAGERLLGVSVDGQDSNTVLFTIFNALTGISPGAATGGTLVTVTGTNLGANDDGGMLHVGGVTVATESWTNTSVAFNVPSDLPPGLTDVHVEVGSQSTNTLQLLIQPSLLAAAPAAGAGGTWVTLAGANLGDAATTSTLQLAGFDLTPATWSTQAITFIVPSTLRAGITTLTVNAAGEPSNTIPFSVLPALTTIVPATATAGTVVPLDATNLGTEMGTLTVDGASIIPTLWDNDGLTFVVPDSIRAGLLDLFVTVAGLDSNHVQLTLDPVLLSLNPTVGVNGTFLNLSGTNFGALQGGGSVNIGGVSATIGEWSGTHIGLYVPPTVTAGITSVQVSAGGRVTNVLPLTVRPSLASMTPVTGPAGTEITLSGFNFGATQGDGAVTFGALSIAPLTWDNTSISLTLPVDMPAGNHAVTVYRGGQPSNVLFFGVTQPGVPYIGSLSPVSGPVLTPITLVGGNFGSTQGASTVSFGGFIAGVTSWSGSTLLVEAPALLPSGTYNVVAMIGGMESNAVPFDVVSATSPYITAVSPLSGSAGSIVVLSGYRFGVTQGASVLRLGGLLVTPLGWTDNSITVAIPTNVVAGVQSFIATVGGEASNSARFTVVPVITDITPASGPQGTTVTLTGTNFGDSAAGGQLSIGGQIVTALTWSNPIITFQIPAGLTAISHTVALLVNGQPANSVTFTVTTASGVTITDLSPRTGSADTLVTLDGANFGSSQGASAVVIGATAIPVLSWSDVQITFSLPATITAGDTLIEVQTLAGNSNSVGFSVFPTTLSVAPASVTGGTLVTITGTNFGAARNASTLSVAGFVWPTQTWSDTAVSFFAPTTVDAGTHAINLIVGGYASNTTSVSIEPSITGVTPAVATGGTTITLSGANFGALQNGSLLRIAGEDVSPASWSQTSIVMVLPSDIPAQTATVQVTVNSLPSTVETLTILPSITSFTPAAVTGSTLVTLTGRNFGPSAASSILSVGGWGIASDSWSSGSISFAVPATLASGATPVQVTVGGQSSNIVSLTLSPFLGSLSPTTGTAGAVVTLGGNNFGASPSASVLTVGGVDLIPDSWNLQSVSFTVPVTLPAGLHAVTLTVGGQVSNALPFTVQPTLLSITPAVGVSTTLITVSGSNFGSTKGTSQLTLNGTSIPTASWSDDTITFSVPNFAGGNYDVAVLSGGETSNTLAFYINPQILTLTPLAGPAGTSVTIAGSNFGGSQGGSVLHIGAVTVTPVSWSDSQIVFDVPPEVSPGSQPVTAVVGGRNASPGSFTVVPTLTLVSPNSVTGGTRITLSGSNFGTAAEAGTLTLGGTTFPWSSWTNTQIEFFIPLTTAAGVTDVVVIAGGEFSNARPLTTRPFLTSLTPASGAAGTYVTVTGTNFGSSQGANGLQIGGVSVSATTWTTLAVTFVVPPTVVAGSADVVLTVAGLTSNALAFTVAPTITALSPTSGTGGDSLTISGSNFGPSAAGNSVRLGTATVTPVGWSNNSINIQVPADLVGGIHPVDVTVAGQTSNAQSFTVLPSLISLSPVSVTGGVTVTIAGRNFGATSGASVVRVGGVVVAPATWAMQSITFALPMTLPSGIAGVAVTVDGQTSNTLPLTIAPTLQQLLPATGTGSTTITLLGANFGPTATGNTLSLGSTLVTPTAWFGTAITFVVPTTLVAGNTSVQLAVAGQNSNVLPFVVTPAILSAGPVSGSAGTIVTVSGTNLGTASAAGVITLGGTPVVSTSWADLSVSFAIPATVSAGLQPLIVTVNGQASNASSITVLPVAQSLSPVVGFSGTTVRISGVNFGAAQGASQITIGGASVAPLNWSSTLLTFQVPASVAAGSVDVSVTVGAQTSAALPFTVRPAIASLLPSAGPAGTSVVLSGSNFGAVQGTNTVTIGGSSATVNAWSPTSISITIPALAAGSHNIQALINGQASNAIPYVVTAPGAPYIGYLDPVSGAVGSDFVAYGGNLGALQGGSTITIGGIAPSATVWSDTALTLTVPNLPTGSHAVVATVAGVSTNTLPFAVVTTTSPWITGMAPAAGSANARIRISGARFGNTQDASTVSLGGLLLAPDVWSDTGIEFIIPAGIAAGIHSLVVTVGGEASNSAPFTVVPVIGTRSPALGAQGTVVTLTGTNFGAVQGAGTVTIGGVSVTPDSWSETSILFSVPVGLTAITHDILLNVGGQYANTVTFSVTAASGVAITNISPAIGTAGDTVTLTGFGFGATQGTGNVKIGAVTVAPATWSDTQITFAVPPTAPAGASLVTVEAGALPSNPVSFTVLPTLLGVTPATASGGATLTLTGTNFGTGGTVTIGGTPVATATWNSTSITLVLPNSIRGGAPTVLVSTGGQTSNGVVLTVQPTLLSLTPSSTSSGVNITVAGTNLGASAAGSTLTVGGVPITPSFWSGAALTISIPATLGGGVHNVAVLVGGEPSNTLALTIVPMISAVAPGSGIAATPVTITGTNFGATGTVSLGGVLIPTSGWTDTSITFTLPTSVTGGSRPVVVTSGGQASSAFAFTVTPSIASLTPVVGTGGDSIVVAGGNFGPVTGTSTLSLGGISLTPSAWSDTSITFEVPDNIVSDVHDVIATVGGQTTNASAFTVTPTLNSASPLSGSNGAQITVNGTNFGSDPDAGVITLGGTVVLPTSWSDLAVSFAIPATISAGAQSIVVSVNGNASNALPVTVLPTTNALSPVVGVFGTTVQISGSNFGAAQLGSQIFVDGISIAPLSWSATLLTFQIPASVTAGIVGVQVTVGGQTSAPLPFTLRPTVATLSQFAGPTGTSVIITGNNFGALIGSSEVSVGGVSAVATLWASTSVTITIPAGASLGSQNIQLLVNVQASNAIPFVVTAPGVPYLGYLNPVSGTVGSIFDANGDNFGAVQGGNTVTIGGAAPAATIWNNTALTLTVPVLPAGSHDVVAVIGGVPTNTIPFAVVTATSPWIDGVSPLAGSANTRIRIDGARFGATQGAGTLTIGAVSLTPDVWTDTAIEAIIPAGIAAGLQPIIVTAGGENSNSFLFTVLPVITNRSPTEGIQGTTVTLTGTNFGAAQTGSSLTIGGVAVVPAPANWTENSIAFDVPVGLAAITHDIVLVVGGQYANTVTFTVTATSSVAITNIAPAVGTAGDLITLTGVGFGATQGTGGIHIGTVIVTPSSWSDTLITFAVPATAPAGSSLVTVEANGLPSNAVSFTVTPTVTSVNPAAATGGATITVSGSNFGAGGAGSTITLGGVNLTPASWNHTVITFVLPNTIRGGVRTLIVRVGSQNSNSATLTVQPSLLVATPTAASSGVNLMVSGTNLGTDAASGGSSFTVGGIIVLPGVWSSTSLTFSLPATIPAGTHNLQATVGGQASNTVAFTVLPKIAAVTPASGIVAAPITITGTNFGSTGAVAFGGVSVTTSGWSDTSITLSMPDNVTGGSRTVVVTSGGQTSNAFAFTVNPSLSLLTPNAGTGGDSITLTGANFGATMGTSSLTLDGVTLSPSGWSDTSVSFVIPTSMEAGSRDVVLTAGGELTNTLALIVTPTILSATPSSGSAGTLVTVDGTNFGAVQNGSTITLGGTVVAAASWSALSVTFVIPSGVSAGAQPVVISVNGEDSNAVSITVLPVIQGLSPVVGVRGTVVNITGTNFGAIQGASVITIGGVNVSATLWSTTSLFFKVPAAVAAGNVTVSVTIGGETSPPLPFTIRPSLAALVPAAGPDGTETVLTGYNFGATRGASTVTVGGVSALVKSWNTGSVAVTIPTGLTAGIHNVQAVIGGQSSNAIPFTITALGAPYIGYVTPVSGSVGTTFVAAGGNFGAAQGASTITIGGVPASAVTWSDTSLTITVPALATGSHAVVATVNGVNTNTVLFAVTTATSPWIANVNPLAGSAGTRVRITGFRFGATKGSSTLTLGGTPLAPDIWSDTAIEVLVPNGVAAGIQNFIVTVNGLSNSAPFTVLPVINTISPNSGTQGTPVTLTGTNFGAVQGASTVTLGGVTLAPTGWSENTISWTVPAGLTASLHDVILTVGGQYANTVTFQVTSSSSVSISGISPASGTAGDTVTVDGAGFGAVQGSGKVLIGSLEVSPTFWSATQISFLVPNDAPAGASLISVEAATLLSNAVSFTVLPTLDSITPATTTGGATLTVSGTNFGPYGAGNSLTVGGVVLTTATWDHTTITFVLPDTIPAGQHSVLVNTGGQNSNVLSLTVQPTLTALNPASASSGVNITVAGTNFGPTQGASSFTVGGVPVTPSSWSNTSLTFALPATIGGGVHNVALTVGGESSNTLALTVIPLIAGVTPGSGTLATTLTLTGTNFGATGAVTFGGTSVATTAWSDTSITLDLPANIPGGSRSILVNSGGQSSIAVAFTVIPSIASLLPVSGTGGNSVSVTGGNFGASAGASSITLGGVAVTPTAWSDTSITFVIPSSVDGGARDVVVTVGGQISNASPLTVKPSITSLTPTAGSGGASVTLSGTNFGAIKGASTVTFGGTTITPTSWASTSISLTIPATLASGTHALIVTVGTQASNTLTFTIAPTLSGLSPLVASGGTPITVSGTNFGATQLTSTLTLGGTTLAIDTWSDTSITFTVPNTIPAGIRNVVMTSGGQTSNAVALTINPVLATSTPASGTGGDAIVLAGTNLGATQSGSTLSVGGVTVLTTSWSDTGIGFSLPATIAAGSKTITVTVNGRTSNSLAFTLTPSLDTVAPANGIAGTSITLTGRNLGAVQGSSTLTLGATTIAPATWSGTSITFLVPGSFDPGLYTLRATVGGQLSTTVTFTIRPSISGLAPTSGVGGTPVVISGANFGAAAGSLTFGGASVTPSSWSNTAVGFTVPSTITAGTHLVQITAGGELSNTATFTVSPAITSLSPSSGLQGTLVTVNGTNFGATQGTSSLTLGGVTLTAATWSELSVTFTVPFNITAGVQNVVVTVDGQSSNASPFTLSPRLTSLSPTSGAAGTTVVLNGANYGATQGGSTVSFGGTMLTPTGWSPTAITVSVPATLGAGARNVSVTVGGQTSATAVFTVLPNINSLAPATGSGGDTITLSGSNFGTTQGSVTLGGIAVVPASWSNASITFAIPATTAAGVHNVIVIAAAQSSNAIALTITPRINSLSPTNGSGGTLITIAGVNFGATQGGGGISIGGVGVAAISWSNASLTFNVPTTLAGGAHDVIVTAGGQTSNAASFSVRPSLQTLLPASGIAATVVTLTGTNFGAAQGTSVLTLGGTVLAPSSWSNSSLTFAVPATITAGTLNAAVTVGGQASNTLSFTLRPSIDGLAPASGAAGGTVVLTGANFGASQGGNTVTIGGVQLTASAWAMGSITVTVPASLAAGAHNVVVTVGGQSSAAAIFTIAPTITGLSPTSAVGATSITVNGAGFGASQGTSSITLGGTTVTPTSWTNGSVTFIAPGDVAAGVLGVQITVNSQASNTVNLTVVPSLQTVTPSAGPAGSITTLAGANFGASQAGSSVDFGGVTATVSNWSMNSVSVVVPNLPLGNATVTMTVGGQTSAGLVFTLNDNYTLTGARTLDCDPVDGRIDHYQLTVAADVTDATFDGYQANLEGLFTTRWTVAGRSNVRLDHGTSLAPECGSDVADDNLLFLKFDPSSAADTGERPELTGTSVLVQIGATGKRLFNDTGTFAAVDVIETDGAGPFIYQALAEEDEPVAGEIGVGPGDTLRLRYSESVNGVSLAGVDIDTIALLDNSHTFGAPADIASAVWSASSSANDTLTLGFATTEPTVAVGDSIRATGTLVVDTSGNFAAPFVPFPTIIGGTFSFGAVGPRVLSADYYDLDGNGFLDHVRVLFDKDLNDATFPGYAGRNMTNAITPFWQVFGHTNLRIDTFDAVDGVGGANDKILWLTFAEGAAFDTGTKPDLTASLGFAGLRDLPEGCYVNADSNVGPCTDAAKAVVLSTDVAEKDKAAPVIVRASAKVGTDKVYVSFSETVWGGANSPAYGAGGEIQLTDFTYINTNPGGASFLSAMDSDNCGALDSLVVARSNTAFVAGDLNADRISVASGTALYDGANNAMVAGNSQVIIDTTAPYLVAASSFRYLGKYYLRVVYSEPVNVVDATLTSNYSIEESPASVACTDLGSTPLSIAQVSSTVYDLETGPQCGSSTTPPTYYKITAANVRDVNENELIGIPNFATTLGTDAIDTTRPRLLEAVAVSQLAVRVTYSEPMRQDNVAGSAECAGTFTVGRRCPGGMAE